jgi:hypothetical protein
VIPTVENVISIGVFVIIISPVIFAIAAVIAIAITEHREY